MTTKARMPTNQGQILSLIFTMVLRLCIQSSLDVPVRACLSGYTTIVNLVSDSLQGLHRVTCGANSIVECFGTVVSVSLQHGMPLKVLCDKLSHTPFEPSGWTGNEELGYAKSDHGLPLSLPDERVGLTYHFSIAGNDGLPNRRSLSEWAAG